MTNTDSNTDQPAVYIVQNGLTGPIKIGVSKNVQRRLRELQTGSARKLNLLGWFDCESIDLAFELESQLHKQFKANAMSGEWFGFLAFRQIFVMDGFTLNPEAAPFAPPDGSVVKRKKDKSDEPVKPDWCDGSLWNLYHNRRNKILGKKQLRDFRLYRNEDSCSPMQQDAIESIYRVSGCNLKSKENCERLYSMRVLIRLFDVGEQFNGNLRCIWHGNKGSYIIAEFMPSGRVLVDIDHKNTKARGVELSHFELAIYVGVVSKPSSKRRAA